MKAIPFDLAPYDERTIKFAALFRTEFMDLRVSLPPESTPDLCWQTVAECFLPEELLIKQAFVDTHFPKRDE